MRRIRGCRGLAAFAVALLVVLAGCSGGVTPGDGGGNTNGGTGTVNFYLSDQQNAIDQFEHLNVTVTSVTLVRTDAENDTATPTENDSTANDTAGNDTAGNTTASTASATPDASEAADGERITYDVDNVTVDLTELQGANATQLGAISVPDGTYTQVVVEISAVEGTLTDGSEADVKLPSGRLRLNEEFAVGNGEIIDFVFDVTVFERGPNGYILRPVAGESGTGDEVDIRPTDRGNDGAAGDRGSNGAGNGDGNGSAGAGNETDGDAGANGTGSANGNNGNGNGNNGNGGNDTAALRGILSA